MTPMRVRIFLYITLSLGISLTFLPYNNSKIGYIETESVTLEKHDILSFRAIKSQFPNINKPKQLIDITESALNPNDYPDLWRAFINLGDDWLNESADIKEWQMFLPNINKNIPEHQLVIFRDQLIYCNNNVDHLTLKYIGKYNPQIKTLTQQELIRYPKIIEAIEFTTETKNILIPIEQWDSMVNKYLNPIIDSQIFSYDGIYYGPITDSDIKFLDENDTVNNFNYYLLIFGLVFLGISIYFIQKLYFLKSSILPNSAKHSILYDVIALVFITPSAYLLINLMLVKLLMLKPIISSQYLLLIGTFFFITAVPLLSYTICLIEKKNSIQKR